MAIDAARERARESSELKEFSSGAVSLEERSLPKSPERGNLRKLLSNVCEWLKPENQSELLFETL